MTLHMATAMINKGIKKAEELQQRVTVCVVDNYGEVVALHKMDGSLVVSPRFATSKARTSALLGMPTQDLGAYAQPGKPYYGLTHAFGGEMMVIAGGAPVKDNSGKVIGGVGVGGSYDVELDQEIANFSTTD